MKCKISNIFIQCFGEETASMSLIRIKAHERGRVLFSFGDSAVGFLEGDKAPDQGSLETFNH